MIHLPALQAKSTDGSAQEALRCWVGCDVCVCEDTSLGQPTHAESHPWVTECWPGCPWVVDTTSANLAAGGRAVFLLPCD